MNSFIGKNFDIYLERKIDWYLKNKLNFNTTPEFKKIFEVGYYDLFWHSSIRQGKKIIVKEIDNNMRINCYTDSHLCRNIFTNTFEETELVFLKRFLRKGDVFVDIGANIGLYSILASSYVGKNGSVISFEPAPNTYKRLIRNIELNCISNITAQKIAISDSSDTLDLIISKDGYDAWNSLAKPAQGSVFENVRVRCNTIDEIIKINSKFSTAKLIKIDIEGWELRALKGGERFLKNENSPTIVIEFTEQNATNAGTNCKELYKYLNYLGYTLYEYDAITSNLKFSEMRECYPYENLIAVKNIEMVKERLCQIEIL